MGVFVGLDCGGSSSRVMAVDESGTVLFQGQSGAANLVSTPENRLRKNLTHAADGCPSADFVCGCFAGLINPEARARGIAHLEAIFPGACVRAEPDYTAALFAAPSESNIVVISGTGSLVCSRSEAAVVKSGGRGFILGDAGSAYQYGRDALMRYLDDPTGASTATRSLIADLFGMGDEPAIVSTIYKAQTPATIIAKLAKALGADARAGIPYALSSVDRHSEALADVVQRHVERHLASADRLHLCLAGGLWRISPIFKETFEAKLRAFFPARAVEVQRIARPPLHGAVELARQMGQN